MAGSWLVQRAGSTDIERHRNKLEKGKAMNRLLVLLPVILLSGPANAAIVDFVAMAQRNSWAQAGSVTASDSVIAPAGQQTRIGASGASAQDAINHYDIGCQCEVTFGVTAVADTNLDFIVDPATGRPWSFGRGAISESRVDPVGVSLTGLLQAVT